MLISQKFTSCPVLILAVFLCVVFFAGFSFAADEPQTLKQNVYIIHTAVKTPMKEILTSRIQEAFKRLGLNAEIRISSSSQRALMLANEDGDGDAFRVPNIKEIAPENTNNLLIVPESIISAELAVYSKNQSFPVEGWSCLEKFHNGARMGAKILEKNIPGRKTLLASTLQLVKMLDADRIETMVEWDLLADHAIQDLKATQIKKLSPGLMVQPFYLYLHKKHKELIPKLSKMLTEMKNDGFFNQIDKEYIFYTGAQSPVKEVLERRFGEAFKRIGLNFKLVYPGSAQRALVMANENGDGDANRIAGIKKIAPDLTENLILIPEPARSIKFYVYSKEPISVVNGYQSLAHLRNGFRVGAKILEKNIPGQRTILPNATRLFQMLDDGRLDTVVELPFIADKLIKENNYSEIVKIATPIVDQPAYGFIHKKHHALAPKIAKALKEMKTDGVFEKIEADVLKEFNLN